MIVVNEIDRKDTYFYDITLSELEDETQWSENDFKGSSKASEDENKEAKQEWFRRKRNGFTNPKFTSNDYQGK